MKLIIVERSKTATFRRLKETFADDLNVEVVFERRGRNRRQSTDPRGPERRAHERRRLSKDWNGRDYIVIQVADAKKTA
ncbi:MAG TPA: hypothetical protein VGZ27_18240 [Vicinamibacterales bacterium]|jgi:hypothetical protein|nr:hypothetical protein [Vicinamibacterales bacterium]